MTNAKTIKQRWTTALKSGVNASVILRDAFEHTQEHGDTSLLATMIFNADKMGMQAFGKRVRTIVKAVYPDAKIKKNKDGAYSITKGNTYDEKSFDALAAACSEGYSLIGPKMGDIFGVSKPEQSVDEQLKARAKAQAKWIASQDTVQLEAFINEVREAYKVALALKIDNPVDSKGVVNF